VKPLHPSVTLERVRAAVERAALSLDNPGFCAACGADADGCEPDMLNGPCEACGELAVWGASELLFHMAI
jgi:hypothetical protein